MRLSMGAAFLVAGAAAGFVTGLQALSGAGTTPASDGSSWVQEVVNPKDPYALYAVGHFRSEGQLPPPRSSQLYSRLTDDDGSTLRGDCTYNIAGAALPARWWTISVGPVASPSQMVSANAADTILTGDDKLEMTLSRRASSGNWLALPEGANLKLMLTLQEAYDKEKRATVILPAVTKVSCE